MIDAVCISHSQDVDGLVCASLLKKAKKAQCILVDYPELHDAIKGLKKEVNSLYICDLGVDASIVNELKQIRKSTQVVYIDHHPLNAGIQEALKESKVEIVHSLDKCAGILTYQLMKRELPKDASILAAYASLSDYPYKNEEVSSFLQQFDPHLLAFEYSILYYAIARKIDDKQFKYKVIEELSKLKYPHEIENITKLAKEQVEYPIKLMKKSDGKIYSRKNLVYAEVSGSTSVVANTLMHVAKKPTLVCYKKNGNGKIYNLSIRSKVSDKNLGTLISEIAQKVEGSGGGHPLAAGAQLPRKKIGKFISFLDNALK